MEDKRSQAMKEEFEAQRLREFKAFDESKSGVKGLVDSGVTKTPPMFQYGREKLGDQEAINSDDQFNIPIIDLQAIIGNNNDNTIRSRVEVVEKVREASERFGFFQVINHGIPLEVLDDMIEGVEGFHEQEDEEKRLFYTRDPKRVVYYSNFDLFGSQSADWRDTLQVFVAPTFPQPQEVPSVCREILKEYSKKMMELGITLLELLSEALGLDRDHLRDMSCAEGLLILGHYYPPCPEPDLTLGTSKHTDGTFITVLLQNQFGLQISYGEQWINVPPVRGTLVINIGDLLQLITNDKFISAQHRVLANKNGPRTSVASFFRPSVHEGNISKVIGPIKQLLSDKNPPIYKDTDIIQYMKLYVSYARRLRDTSPLQHLKL